MGRKAGPGDPPGPLTGWLTGVSCGRPVSRGDRAAGAGVGIADLHLREPRDWRQIAELYGVLARKTGSAVVEMNRAIAVAELDGPDAGLVILDRLDLGHYRYYHSTRADLLRRAGREAEAGEAYRRALELAETEAERRFLRGRLAELDP